MASANFGHAGQQAISSLGRAGVVRSILVACSGNVVEWFDFFAYAFTALYFAPAFFPSGDTTSQLLNTAGIS